MRSHADRSRRIERLLRTVALVSIALLLWRALRPRDVASMARASGGDVEEALARWSATPPESASVTLDSVPSPAMRDWMAAIARAGTRLRWSAGDEMLPGAVAVRPVADPGSESLVQVAAPAAALVALADDVGALDTLGASPGAVRTVAAEVTGRASAGVGHGVATAAARDSLVLKRVLVLGAARWEAKFAIAALEERGWKVDARVRVAPGVDVTQGVIAPDTARHAAVVALDSTAADLAPAIARYVRAGGGLVMAGDAAGLAPFAPLLPGRAGPLVAGRPITAQDTAPRLALAARPVTLLASDAVPLERQGDRVMVAARRVGRGRVVQVAYTESWRWRLAGGGEPVAAHRAWWARVVGAAAYAPAVALPTVASVPAPYAALVAALGAPSPGGDGLLPTVPRAPWDTILYGAAMVALLAEWALRRVRGAA